MAKFVSDCTQLMRRALGRRNENDPDSSDEILRSYLSDFIHITMSDDIRMFEQFGTLQFDIDETNTTGIYTFNDVGATSDFVTISTEAFITLTDPAEGSISWNRLMVYQDPLQFYSEWGVNNSDVLIPGYPTEMLFYGNELVFRTIPDQGYTVVIYGYKELPELSADGDPELDYDYWLRYISYGAALNYAQDFRFEDSALNALKRTFTRERKLRLTRTHNQIKNQRCKPSF